MEVVMKYHVYGAFVFTLLVSPLFLPVGCSGSVDEGDACSVETAKICSEARDEILICTNGVWTPDMTCTDGTICAIRGEGPECVSEGGTGGSSGSGGSGGAGTGGVGGTACILDSPPTVTPTPPFCDPAQFNMDCCGYPDSYCDTVTNQCFSL
jgi:hypothetical protein